MSQLEISQPRAAAIERAISTIAIVPVGAAVALNWSAVCWEPSTTSRALNLSIDPSARRLSFNTKWHGIGRVLHGAKPAGRGNTSSYTKHWSLINWSNSAWMATRHSSACGEDKAVLIVGSSGERMCRNTRTKVPEVKCLFGWGRREEKRVGCAAGASTETGSSAVGAAAEAGPSGKSTAGVGSAPRCCAAKKEEETAASPKVGSGIRLPRCAIGEAAMPKLDRRPIGVSLNRSTTMLLSSKVSSMVWPWRDTWPTSSTDGVVSIGSSTIPWGNSWSATVSARLTWTCSRNMSTYMPASSATEGSVTNGGVGTVGTLVTLSKSNGLVCDNRRSINCGGSEVNTPGGRTKGAALRGQEAGIAVKVV